MDDNNNRDVRLGLMLGVMAILSCCIVTVFPPSERQLIVAPLMVGLMVLLVLFLRGDGTSPY